MKKTLLLIFGVLVALPCAQILGQVIDVPKAGKYEYQNDSVPPIPPDPPTGPDTLIDNGVKGTQGYQFNFVGNGWTHNATAADTWYKKTMSYSGTAGDNFTFKFDGTLVAVFTEVGPTHGIIEIAIDGVVKKRVDLYAPEFMQRVKVYQKDSLTQDVHTIKLSCTGTKNSASTNTFLIIDYLGINNPRPVPDTPVPPDPQPGGIVIQPGQGTIKAAVESAKPNTKYSLIAGQYNENIINVPVGVTIQGAGIDKSIINFTGSHPAQSETAIFMLRGGGNGNQTISGFTIKGGFRATGGIYVTDRNAVRISDVKVLETTYFGGWIKQSANSEISYCEFYNGSWASVGWVTGELNIFGLTDCSIHHCYFHSDRNDKGYAIKALWGSSTLTRVKIFSNTEKMAKTSIWNNGSAPNIGFEIHDTFSAGMEFYDNFISNVLSLALHKPTVAGRVIVRNNNFTMGGSSYAIELVLSNITVENNTVSQTAIFTANFQPNGKWVDQIVRNNTMNSNGANPSWGGLFLVGPDGANMTITNNAFTNTGNYPLVKYKDSNGSNSSITQSGNTYDGVPREVPPSRNVDFMLMIALVIILVLVFYIVVRKKKTT